MDKNPFLKYVMKDEKEDIFHSSSYGKAQNGGNMGAASAESFETRRRIDENRKMIKGYSNSGVLGQAMGNAPRPKTCAPTKASERAAMRPMATKTLTPPRNPGTSR